MDERSVQPGGTGVPLEGTSFESPPGAVPATKLRSKPIQGHPIIAWLVILGLAGWMVWQANAPRDEDQTLEPTISAQAEMFGQMVVGMRPWLSSQWDDFLLAQARALKTGSMPDRLGYAVLTAEIKGPEQALLELDRAVEGDAEAGVEPKKPTPLQEGLIDVLRNLFESRLAGQPAALTPAQQALLEQTLGWFGRFAPLTQGTADVDGREEFLRPLKRMPVVAIAFALWLLGCAGIGFVVLITLLVLALTGRLAHGFDGEWSFSGVYAETFAVWLLLFTALREAGHLLDRWGVISPGNVLAFSALATILAMSALLWPVLRGVPWSTLRRHVGLHAGHGAATEVLLGPVTYCLSGTLMLVGLVMTIGLMKLQELWNPDAPPPSHPIQEMIAGASWVQIAFILFLGAVLAPITEEIMFRGVLYRHLRVSSRGVGLVLSAMFSALISSAIFAAIHPQGWTFIPALGSLAIGFCIVREWRGSLVPCMIAHGIQNGVTLTMSILLFSRV